MANMSGKEATVMDSARWSSLVHSKSGIPPPDVHPGMLVGVQSKRWLLFLRHRTWKSLPNARLEDLLSEEQRVRNGATREVEVDPKAPHDRESTFFVEQSPVEVGADVSRKVEAKLGVQLEAYQAQVAAELGSESSASFKGTGCSLDYLVLTDYKLKEFVWRDVPRSVMGDPKKTRVHFIFAVMYSNEWTTTFKSKKKIDGEINVPLPHTKVGVKVHLGKEEDGTFVYKATTGRFPVAVMIASFEVVQDEKDPETGRRSSDIQYGVIAGGAMGLGEGEEGEDLPDGPQADLPAVSSTPVPCATGRDAWKQVAELMLLREPVIALEDSTGGFAKAAKACGIEVGPKGELHQLIKEASLPRVDIDPAYEPLPRLQQGAESYLLWRRR